MPAVAEHLKTVLALIAARHRPASVLLFGSHARQEPKPASDIDLCILYDKLPKRHLEVLQDLYRVLFGQDLPAVDLIVYETESFQKLAARAGSFEQRVLRDAVLVYGAALCAKAEAGPHEREPGL